MKNKIFFTNLKSLFLHPIFILLLLLTCYTIYIFYIANPALCDDGGSSLYELKTKLTKEIANYRIAIIKHECYSDLNQQLWDISRPNFRNFSQENLIHGKITLAENSMADSVERIGKLEAAIKKIDAKFSLTQDFSAFHNIKFPRIGKI